MMKDFAENFDLNDYEFNSKSDIGIYIIHGFSSTTHEVKELAEFLGSCGFHTRANNLPGHGTDIDDCNNTIYAEWLEHVERDFADMISQNKKIYVVGASMGGALALHLASLFPINGVVTCAAVLHFKDHFTLRWINPITKFFYSKVSKRKRFDKNIRYDLKFNGVLTFVKSNSSTILNAIIINTIIRITGKNTNIHDIFSPYLKLHTLFKIAVQINISNT